MPLRVYKNHPSVEKLNMCGIGRAGGKVYSVDGLPGERFQNRDTHPNGQR